MSIPGTTPSTSPWATGRTSGEDWLDVCWRAVVSGERGPHPEVESLLAEHAPDPEQLATPEERYRYHAIRALLDDGAGLRGDARRHAREALLEKANVHHGFAFHPRAGATHDEEAAVDARLVGLAQ